MNNYQLREKLKKIERKALDEGKYYDILNMFEAMQKKPLTQDEKKILDDAYKTGDADIIQAAQFKVDTGRDPQQKAKLKNAGVTADILENFVEEEVGDIDDDFTLTEGRYNLKPVRCISKASRNVYYSPFDSRLRRFAKYGQRYVYDTKQACEDAIKDMDNTFGYKKNEDDYYPDWVDTDAQEVIVKGGREIYNDGREEYKGDEE